MTAYACHTGDPATCQACVDEKATQRDRNRARGLRALTWAGVDLGADHAEDWHQRCVSDDDCANVVCLNPATAPHDQAVEGCPHAYCDLHRNICPDCSRQIRVDARS